MHTMVDTYAEEQGGSRLRGGVAVAVVVTHLLLIAGVLVQRPQPAPPQPEALMVTMIPAPEQPLAPPPPVPKVEKTPPVLATTRRVEAAPKAPVIPPEPQQTAEVVPDAPPSPPAPVAPPSPPAPAAVVPPNVRAAYANNPQPVYPSASRRLNEQGISRLRVLVGADGRVQNLELEKSSGFARLDAAAMTAVRDWKFAPARQGESAVPAWVLVPINWKLER
jgi:protein TonB